MEQNQQESAQRQDFESPRYAALRGAFEGFGSIMAIPFGFAGIIKLFNRAQSYSELVKQTFTGWSGKLQIGLTAFSTIFGAVAGASNAQRHNQILQDNIDMRAQLNQTGQILMHVANAVQHGKLADSTLVLDETTAPPSHVARLQTQQAAQAVSDAMPELAPNASTVTQPAASHAEAVLNEKAAAAEAAPTIH